MDATASGPELADYVALARRHWWRIAAGALGGGMAAAIVLLVLPPTYTATAAVQVRPTGAAELTGELSGRTNGGVNLDTEAQVVRSNQVAEPAVSALATGEDLDEVRERLTITVPPNSSVLRIGYSAASAEEARDGATAFAEAYLSHRKDTVTGYLDTRLQALRSELDGQREALTELAETAATETGAVKTSATTRITATRDEISSLNSQISELSTVRASLDPGQVITAATAPESPSSPVPALWLSSGTLLGLATGVLTAHLAERSGPRPPRSSRGRHAGRAALSPAAAPAAEEPGAAEDATATHTGADLATQR
ncbi:Wzz/FepE/Etk N-terminal domain-containing protein [Salinactinospora qingdaonensis]|uniref:Polysaccharide chain length determinant N-terminal domain-containing protein n=1 Tax=Salinactinospora qingdaonensis TaxID=702744 RepID=A0ABP7FLE1_9ACTN